MQGECIRFLGIGRKSATWCSLFVGPCNISFQLWDSEAMRNLYCEECGEWKNYGKDPSKWGTK